MADENEDEEYEYAHSNAFSWIDDSDNSGMIDADEVVDQFNVRTTTETRTSRYRKLKRLINNRDEQYVETAEPFKVPKNADDTFHIVSMKDENRLDLISWQYYGNTYMWWVIAEASDIIDPFDIPKDTVLRIPNKANVIGFNDLVS